LDDSPKINEFAQFVGVSLYHKSSKTVNKHPFCSQFAVKGCRSKLPSSEITFSPLRAGAERDRRVEVDPNTIETVEEAHALPQHGTTVIEEKRSSSGAALSSGAGEVKGCALASHSPGSTTSGSADQQAMLVHKAEIESRYHIPQAWAEFIDAFLWNWYVDLTFKGFPHPERADKGFMRFVHRLNRDAFGVKYWKDKRKGVTWARATEKQQRGCDHYHAFIGNVPSFISMMHYFEDWRREEGLCRFRVYDKTLGASYYMAKHTYAWKDGQIDLSENLRYALDGSLVKASDIEQSNINEYRFLRPLKLMRCTS